MPIYAYRCDSCGHAKDVLQKLSDPVLSTCPSCGAASFRKQVTAAGFQLKGSGWYVTDFRGGNSAGKSDGNVAKPDGNGAKPADTATDAGASKESTPAPAAASGGGDSAPAGGCGSACACH